MPTICAIAGEPLPTRPIDGVDLTALLDGKMAGRPKPLYFWCYNTGLLGKSNPEPWMDPELQKGTTPLAKLAGGKPTRDFRNVRHPTISGADFLGPRAIIDGNFKLVIHEQKKGGPKHELFDLESDPAEKTDLIGRQPATAEKLQTQLRQWQQSVLHSLVGMDYLK